ncbi:sphingomyelin phosphodiesterase-like [Paramacrobiotus metropolitanus]|uniref:sphingomyelin phosphodiesterase-like n=1 Tax=Paramacrobiotus metropolitanus TaxID=2943436 RepID=UPI00244579F4|nr:sphingomyelin phosphodiesterase-like [Paramacrobiotus metropolitanus]
MILRGGIVLVALLICTPVPQISGNILGNLIPLSLDTYQVFESLGRLKTNYGFAKWNINQQLTCTSCKFGFSTLQTLLKLHLPPDRIAAVIEDLCVQLKIEPRIVCRGLLEEFRPETFYVLTKVPYSPAEICNFVTNVDCAPDPPGTAWSVPLPDIPKPPVQVISPPSPGAKTLRVLQLSDLHFDMYYQEGTNAECEDPLCCRKEGGKPVGPPAGRWGDPRNCDSPIRLIENMLTWISKNEKIDYILWTGDLPAHDIWNQTKQMQLIILKLTTKYLRSFFPNTPVFPALGNHESSPVDSFPPRFINDSNSIKWLYDALATTWNQWLPPDAISTVSGGGYYRVKPFPGLRIISLNTNACNTMNWWLLLNMTDPDNELQWLINELQEAENAGDKVHLIGHIPPGSGDCMKMWSYNFYRIIERYESTIAAQFYGHEHSDSMHIYYDPADESHVTGLGYLGPSVTPYVGFNPSYRIYTIDGNYANSSWIVLDHETYIVNLTEANLPNGTPKWVKEYSAKEAYGLNQLLPGDWNDLMDEFLVDDAKFQKFWQYYWKSQDTSVAKGCNDACRKYLLCRIRTRNKNCIKVKEGRIGYKD